MCISIRSQLFSLKGHLVKMLGFANPEFSVTTTEPCIVVQKQLYSRQCMNKRMCLIPIKSCLQKQATDWIWSMGHNLLVPELKAEGVLIFKYKNL